MNLSTNFSVLQTPQIQNRNLSPVNPSLFFSTCYAACQLGDLQQVKFILNLDSTLISQFDSGGQTLLANHPHVAVRNKFMGKIQTTNSSPHKKNFKLISSNDLSEFYLNPLHVLKNTTKKLFL